MTDRHDRLARLVGRLGQPDDPLGCRARDAAVREGGLSPAMADWAFRTTCARYTAAALAALPAPRGRRVAVVLSASVPTAPIRAVIAPLAGGAEVVVRASRRQPTVAGLLVDALAAAGFPVALGPADREAFLRAAVDAGVDLVVAYGTDEAIAALDRAVPAGIGFEGRGHGFGLAWVAADAARSDAAAEAVALDVAAYDQHGCLSPQLVAVEDASAEAFAERLHRALADLEPRLPRGRVDAVRILQWQGATAAVAAGFWRGPTHAVAALHTGPVPGSPGGRNVAVVPVRSPAEAAALLGDRRRFVTNVGLAGTARPPAELHAVFAPARIVAAGSMQDPPLDGPEDPRPARGRDGRSGETIRP